NVNENAVEEDYDLKDLDSDDSYKKDAIADSLMSSNQLLNINRHFAPYFDN
ncbi:6056_t:CDS:2, partial [Funneliformis caledonium]